MKHTLVLAALLLASFPAVAQVGPSIGGSGTGFGGGTSGFGGTGGSRSGLPSRSHDDDDGGDQSKGAPEKTAEPPPSIPGALPDADAVVIPSDKVAAEMSPNDALFDAINRGDLGAAKDALNRGAQLDAHNVLGQTPTDASIDLSRNDITFLLLSMRGSVPRTRATSLASSAQQQPVHRGKATLVKTAARPARSQAMADRGTPNPAVGFTGF